MVAVQFFVIISKSSAKTSPFCDRHLRLIFAPPGVDRKCACSETYLGFTAVALKPAFPALSTHRARKGCFHFETEICFAQAIEFVDASAMRKIQGVPQRHTEGR